MGWKTQGQICHPERQRFQASLSAKNSGFKSQHNRREATADYRINCAQRFGTWNLGREV